MRISVGLIWIVMVALILPARAGEPVRLNADYRLHFAAGDTALDPGRDAENRRALARIADLFRSFGNRTDVEMVVLAGADEGLNFDRTMILQRRLRADHGLAPGLLFQLRPMAAPVGRAALHLALRQRPLGLSGCPWVLELNHPALPSGAGLSLAAGAAPRLALPAGATVRPTARSSMPHRMAYATTPLGGLMIGQGTAAPPAMLHLIVARTPIPTPEGLKQPTENRSGDGMQRMVGDDWRSPELVPAGPGRLSCKVELVALP